MAARTYKSFMEWGKKSLQKEYTEPTKLLDDNGKLLSPGWARHNVFDYDRTVSTPNWRKKEWDFYQIGNRDYMVQISFANISIGGYAGAKIVDLKTGEVIVDGTEIFFGGNNNPKFILPPKGDVPNRFQTSFNKITLDFNTEETSRTIYFKAIVKGKVAEFNFQMDIMPGLENITTVLPFENQPTRYFMTTKQNCMPCAGTVKYGDRVIEFSKDDTFCALDWGRVNTPHQMVWYWGNGSQYITDENGEKHIFGFEITWAIGDESNATETCLFYDGKAHKFGAVDVKTFPKPDKFSDTWEFISEDGRFNLKMEPFFDYHTDLNMAYALRMHTHQVHGIWSGDVTLDDGTKLEIKDMYAFCEYVENHW